MNNDARDETIISLILLTVAFFCCLRIATLPDREMPTDVITTSTKGAIK